MSRRYQRGGGDNVQRLRDQIQAATQAQSQIKQEMSQAQPEMVYNNMTKEIEDQVGRYMTQTFVEDINKFVNDCSRSLDRNSLITCHGRYGLHRYSESRGVDSMLADIGVQHAELASVTEYASEFPPQIEMIVMNQSPSFCDSYSDCINDSNIKSVTDHMRALRTSIHNNLRNSNSLIAGLRDTVEDSIHKKGRSSDVVVDLIDSSKIEIEKLSIPTGSDPAHPVFRTKNSSRRESPDSVLACEGRNMPVLDSSGKADDVRSPCFPLKDSLNTIITYELAFPGDLTLKQSFNLLRLSILIRIKVGQDVSVIVPVTFLEVSFIKGEDYRYSRTKAMGDFNIGDFKSNHVNVDNQGKGLPFPSVRLMFVNLLMQLRALEIQMEASQDVAFQSSVQTRIEDLRSSLTLAVVLMSHENILAKNDKPREVSSEEFTRITLGVAIKELVDEETRSSAVSGQLLTLPWFNPTSRDGTDAAQRLSEYTLSQVGKRLQVLKDKAFFTLVFAANKYGLEFKKSLGLDAEDISARGGGGASRRQSVSKVSNRSATKARASNGRRKNTTSAAPPAPKSSRKRAV